MIFGAVLEPKKRISRKNANTKKNPMLKGTFRVLRGIQENGRNSYLIFFCQSTTCRNSR